MNTLKKLFALVVVVAVLGGAAAAYLRSSVLYSVYEMAEAGDKGDLPRLEQVVDIDAWAKVAVGFAAGYTKGSLRKSGVVAGALGHLAAAFLEGTKEAAAPDIAAEIREKVRQGGAFRKIGPWTPNEGLSALGAIEPKGDNLTYVTLKGNCEGERVSARILFHRLKGAGPLGLFDDWRTSGMDAADLQRVVEACVRADAKKAAVRR